jgi:toxin ParE1/3/4
VTVIWLPQSEQDRRDIGTYIAADNPAAARSMDELFDRAAHSLELFPDRGRRGVITGTREIFPHHHYRMIYEIDGEDVYILAVVHTSRQWPPLDG